MRFAIVNAQRQEAQPYLSGECPACDQAVISKCGQLRIWHWAHKGRRDCDPWCENETEWHRAWKDQFPLDWQEIVHHAEDGQRHIADVKTFNGWVIEFQHSGISLDERQSREAYYQSMIWVVDGTRRQRDAIQFSRALAIGESRDPLSSKRRLTRPKSALLRDWARSRAHVFFDFGDQRALWWLFPESDELRAYVQSISRAEFVRVFWEKCAHGPSEFDSRVQNFTAFIASYEPPPPSPRPPQAMEIRPNPTFRPMIRRAFRL